VRAPVGTGCGGLTGYDHGRDTAWWLETGLSYSRRLLHPTPHSAVRRGVDRDRIAYSGVYVSDWKS
jgi:hypothetical protein